MYVEEEEGWTTTSHETLGPTVMKSLPVRKLKSLDNVLMKSSIKGHNALRKPIVNIGVAYGNFRHQAQKANKQKKHPEEISYIIPKKSFLVFRDDCWSSRNIKKFLSPKTTAD